MLYNADKALQLVKLQNPQPLPSDFTLCYLIYTIYCILNLFYSGEMTYG